jgi:hypothetical protein
LEKEKNCRADVGSIDEHGAICIAAKGPVELWSNPCGDYVVYLHIGEDVFLYNRREYPEDANQLFHAAVKMVKRR